MNTRVPHKIKVTHLFVLSFIIKHFLLFCGLFFFKYIISIVLFNGILKLNY